MNGRELQRIEPAPLTQMEEAAVDDLRRLKARFGRKWFRGDIGRELDEIDGAMLRDERICAREVVRLAMASRLQVWKHALERIVREAAVTATVDLELFVFEQQKDLFFRLEQTLTSELEVLARRLEAIEAIKHPALRQLQQYTVEREIREWRARFDQSVTSFISAAEAKIALPHTNRLFGGIAP